MGISKKDLFNFFLPYPWNIHARGLFITLIAGAVGWFISESSHLQSACMSGLISFFDYEIIYWASIPLFKIQMTNNREHYTLSILWRVVVFYIIIIFVGVLVSGSIIAFLTFHNQTHFHLGEAIKVFINYGLRPTLYSLAAASLVSTIIYFFCLWQETLKSMYKTREEALIYQSETLKNQINPHFLFNSLNTLSSLISIDPTRAEYFTQKLSNIYRYILENREKQQVPLKEELDFVRNFYFLQKIRDEEKIELCISLEDEEAYNTLPISIQLLVENAFKHNIATKEKHLLVSIVQKNGMIEVSNNFQPKTKISESTGIGLKNLKERIKIHTGGELQIVQTPDKYTVTMPLLPNSKN